MRLGRQREGWKSDEETKTLGRRGGSAAVGGTSWCEAPYRVFGPPRGNCGSLWDLHVFWFVCVNEKWRKRLTEIG